MQEIAVRGASKLRNTETARSSGSAGANICRRRG